MLRDLILIPCQIYLHYEYECRTEGHMYPSKRKFPSAGSEKSASSYRFRLPYWSSALLKDELRPDPEKERGFGTS